MLSVPGVFTGWPLLTWISSMPTHSSLPTALVVMMRTCSVGALFASDGRVTLTGVVSSGLALFGPAVASAT